MSASASTAQLSREEFVTNGLGTAAFIVAKKALPLLRIEVDHSGRALFVFKDPLSLGPQLEADFLANDGECPALRFHTELRVLRKQIDAQKYANSARSMSTRSRNGFSSNPYKEQLHGSQHSGRR